MKILKQEEHDLLKRSQLELEIEHSGFNTPRKEDILKQISESFKVPGELIRIKAIYTRYGGNYSKVIANVYKEINALKEIEEFRKKKKEKKTAPPKKE